MDDSATPGAAVASPTFGSPAEPPDILRARRVLSGDIRPDDYLPVPDAVRSRIDRLLAESRERLNGADPSPEFMRWHFVQELLSYHHGGEILLYLDTAAGVVVLAAGFERCGAVIRIVTPNDPILSTCTPEPW